MSQGQKRRIQNITSEADRDVLRAHYEFVPSSSHATKESSSHATSWQDRMVRHYHEGLYKEYALADLSCPGRLGLRWRTKQEVVEGRGDQSCGNKRCLALEDLSTLEVPFAYQEAGVAKKELVKLRLCPACVPHVRSMHSQSTARHKERSKRNRSDEEGDVDAPDSSSSVQEERQRRKRPPKKISRKKRGDGDRSV